MNLRMREEPGRFWRGGGGRGVPKSMPSLASEIINTTHQGGIEGGGGGGWPQQCWYKERLFGVLIGKKGRLVVGGEGLCGVVLAVSPTIRGGIQETMEKGCVTQELRVLRAIRQRTFTGYKEKDGGGRVGGLYSQIQRRTKKIENSTFL